MTLEDELSIIEKLRNDKDYFGEFGKKFISNSDIKSLLNSPDQFQKPLDDSVDFLKGRYLHYKVLQPELFKDGKSPLLVIDCSTRNSSDYKKAVLENISEEGAVPIFLLQKEVQELNYLANCVTNNKFFKDCLQNNREKYEVEEPAIGEIMGYLFKGKADRINKKLGIIADFKTTKSLSSFTFNFKKYGYHTQAYIYQKLFGLPVRFFVVDKESGRLGLFDVDDVTLEQAEQDVQTALNKFEYYYGENAIGDINEFYEYGVL